MKKILLSTFILSAMAGFITFIYEPVTMYANNIEDFQFDLYTLFWPSFLAFLVSFILISGIMLILRAMVGKDIYVWILALATALLVCVYIHGNFLSNFLPSLGETTINWNDITANIVSVIICLICLIGAIVCCLKVKQDTIIKSTIFIPLAIFVMLCTALVSTAASTDVFKQKEVVTVSTNKNINMVSSDENFVILLADAVDSQAFSVKLSNPMMNMKPYLKTLHIFQTLCLATLLLVTLSRLYFLANGIIMKAHL